jgi:FkbM family methyltransferase
MSDGFHPKLKGLPLFLKRAYPAVLKRWNDMTAVRGFAVKPWGGGALLLQHRNFLDRQIAYYGDFEEAQQRVFFGAMEQHGCDVFLDIGANIGIYSIAAAKSGLAKRVVAFEPDERNALQLGANLLINDLAGRVEIVRAAVSEQAGELSFVPASSTSTGQSRVGTADGAVRVQALRMDDFLPLTGAKLFAKMDIEGHEGPALRGMSRLLRENKVFLQVEAFGEGTAMRDFLQAHGLREQTHIDHDYYFTNF